MATKNSRITTVVDEEIADWLRQCSEMEGRSISEIVRDIIAKCYGDESERFWAREGEGRLATFDRHTAVSHEGTWDRNSTSMTK
jgi:hypothetical protein